jgi:hypothetical protein
LNNITRKTKEENQRATKIGQKKLPQRCTLTHPTAGQITIQIPISIPITPNHWVLSPSGVKSAI